MTEAESLLKALAEALDGAFISSWQSTAAWQKELEAALYYLQKKQIKMDILELAKRGEAPQ